LREPGLGTARHLGHELERRDPDARDRQAHDLRRVDAGLRHVGTGGDDLHGEEVMTMKRAALALALAAATAVLVTASASGHTTPGVPTNDPDGAAARMTAFVNAMGGTKWAGSQTQYYETVNGQNVYIQNPTNVFGGVWYDNTNPIHDNVTGLELAQEAQRAV